MRKKTENTRKAVRRRTNIPVRIFTPAGVEYVTTMFDLSQSGMRIIKPRTYSGGDSSVIAYFRFPKTNEIAVACSVIYESLNTSGVHFDDVIDVGSNTPDKQQAFNQMISDYLTAPAAVM